MPTVRTPPGHAAAIAFRTGTIAAAVIGLGVIAVLYWGGSLSLLAVGYTVVALFPVYMLIVAAVLSVWLGYDRGTAALRPVPQSGDED
ncbi:hypothetical protein [Halosegnis sp.]|uniref:hypothetical protein n=1 Tax=Halosegnis sp. TaxID=2864959 RepID=UPI0035D42D71